MFNFFSMSFTATTLLSHKRIVYVYVTQRRKIHFYKHTIHVHTYSHSYKQTNLWLRTSKTNNNYGDNFTTKNFASLILFTSQIRISLMKQIA